MKKTIAGAIFRHCLERLCQFTTDIQVVEIAQLKFWGL
jgi:hypothetical protein